MKKLVDFINESVRIDFDDFIDEMEYHLNEEGYMEPTNGHQEVDGWTLYQNSDDIYTFLDLSGITDKLCEYFECDEDELMDWIEQNEEKIDNKLSSMCP